MILKPKTNSFDLLRYSGDNFHLVLANIEFAPNSVKPKNDQLIKFTFGYFDERTTLQSIVFVSEEFNDEDMTYKRDFEEYFIFLLLKKPKKNFNVHSKNTVNSRSI